MKLFIQGNIVFSEIAFYRKSHPRESGDPEKRLDSRLRGNDKFKKPFYRIYPKCIASLSILFYIFFSFLFMSYSITFEKGFNADKVMTRSKYIVLGEFQKKRLYMFMVNLLQE